MLSLKALAFQVDTDPIYFSDPNQVCKVNDFVKVFRAPDTISSQMALTRILNGEMEQVPYQGNPGMTNSDAAYWLLFTVVNDYSGESNFRLVLSYPQLDYTSLSEVNGDTTTTMFITGDSFPFDQRPVSNHDFVFPIEIPFGSQKTFLLNADKRNSAVRFPLRLYAEEKFVTKSGKEQVYLTVYYIFLVILTLVAFLIGLGLKNRVFIWYGVSVFCYALWLFTWQGFSYKYLTGDFPVFNRHFLAFCSQIAVMSLLVFVQSFFETKSLIPRFHRIMNGVLGLFILGTVVWVIIPNTYIEFAPKLFALRYILVGMILTFSITAAIVYRKRGAHRSIIFAISYALFFVSIIGKILDEYGLIAEYNFVVDPILVGNLVQVLGLSVAMVITMVNIVKERELLKRANDQLKASLGLNGNRFGSNDHHNDFITLKSKAVLNLNDILYINSDAAYCEFFLKEREHPEIDRRSLTSLEDELPEVFVRIHRSTIVNLRHVRQVKATSILLNTGQKLVVSRTYKDQLREALGDKK